MANIDTLKSGLTDIANAIRGKTGKTDTMTLSEMPGEINGISGGGGETDKIILSTPLENVSENAITMHELSPISAYGLILDESAIDFYDYVYFDATVGERIITDIQPTIDTRIEVEFLPISTGNFQVVFGNSVGDEKNFSLATIGGTTWYTAINADEISFELAYDEKHKFVWNNKNHEYVADGVVVGKSNATDIYKPGAYLWITAREWSYSYTQHLYKGNIYSLKVIDNNTDTVLHELKPISKGFFDTVTKKLYTNAYAVGKNEED